VELGRLHPELAPQALPEHAAADQDAIHVENDSLNHGGILPRAAHEGDTRSAHFGVRARTVLGASGGASGPFALGRAFHEVEGRALRDGSRAVTTVARCAEQCVEPSAKNGRVDARQRPNFGMQVEWEM
jgi:hypothetical protein